MSSNNTSWELVILVFAIAVTALTGIAYQIMLVYSVNIPWFVWAALVALSLAIAVGARSIRRRPGR